MRKIQAKRCVRLSASQIMRIPAVDKQMSPAHLVRTLPQTAFLVRITLEVFSHCSKQS